MTPSCMTTASISVMKSLISRIDVKRNGKEKLYRQRKIVQFENRKRTNRNFYSTSGAVDTKPLSTQKMMILSFR